MRIVVAPDSFKGTYTAGQVAAAVAGGIRSRGVEAIEAPVADGGEGTLNALLRTLEGERRWATVSGPFGTPIDASWGWVAEKELAIVESAEACGLHLSGRTPRDAIRASTAGVGELIRLAAEAGARRIAVAIGGTATTDGGTGALAALQGATLAGVHIEVLSDVSVSFEKAAEIFAGQKGADDTTIQLLSERLAAQAESFSSRYGRDPRGIPRTGGAGGLSGALWAAFGADLLSGADAVLDLVGFDAMLAGAAGVVVGEGCLDAQTLEGKIVSAIIRRSGSRPVYAVAGSVRLSAAEETSLQLQGIWTATDERLMSVAGREIAERVVVDAGGRPTDQNMPGA
jgi:glycerate kinase